MAWLAVHSNGEECIFTNKPYRVDPIKSLYKLWEPKIWSDRDVSKYGNEDTEISIPKGTIKKLIGRDLKWEDEPIELK